MIEYVHGWALVCVALGAIVGAGLGAASGALARRWVGGWMVPCRPREREEYERRIERLRAYPYDDDVEPE